MNQPLHFLKDKVIEFQCSGMQPGTYRWGYIISGGRRTSVSVRLTYAEATSQLHHGPLHVVIHELGCR
jgi:hypothetical protein